LKRRRRVYFLSYDHRSSLPMAGFGSRFDRPVDASMSKPDGGTSA
jgi:hypothetical protein